MVHHKMVFWANFSLNVYKRKSDIKKCGLEKTIEVRITLFLYFCYK